MMPPEKVALSVIKRWEQGDRDFAGPIRLALDEAVSKEKERIAKIVDGWHYKKGGHGILAEEIRKGGF